MKTNHRRGFTAATHRNKAMTGYHADAPLSDQTLTAIVSGDFCNGNRGMARAVRGAKKFIRSRTRFHENQATRRLAGEFE